MPAHVQPVKGRWYYDAQTGRRLQVTRIDEHDRHVEAQFEDGRTEPYTQAAWRALQLEPQDEEASSRDPGYRLSNDEFRRATGWAEKSPDDFPDG